jgi:hypothetical protein
LTTAIDYQRFVQFLFFRQWRALKAYANARGIRIVYQRVVQHYRAGDWVVDKDRPREIVPVDNPLESTGLLREGQAIELFNRRDYGAAALVFQDVAKKVTGVKQSHYYRGLLLNWRRAMGPGTWRTTAPRSRSLPLRRHSSSIETPTGSIGDK